MTGRPVRRRALLLGLMLGGAPGLAAAQGRDAWPADTMAQRMQACTPCHGKEGRATAQGYFPRIAGKPAGYLFNQLQHFRDGRREHGPMTRLLQPLSDAYLREMAAYFAALDLPYAAPPAAAVPSAAVRAHGERLVREGDAARAIPACSACHGERLTGALPAWPGLLGLPRDYLVAQLGAWRTGQRRAAAPDCMAQIAQRLSLADIEAVTQWLAAQAPAADMAPAAAAQIRPPTPLECGSGGR